jgi:nitrogen fixation protein FixH
MAPSSTARNPTMTDLTRNAPLPRKSLWIPALFVGLMLLVVAVNGTMMYFAESTFSGLDTDQAYQEGIDYNTTLQEAAANAALGWAAKTAFTPAVAGSRHVTVTITDKTGAPIAGLQVSAHLVRPVSTAFDQALTLRSEAAGTYGADVALPALGSWELRLSARDGKTHWQTVQRVFVK